MFAPPPAAFSIGHYSGETYSANDGAPPPSCHSFYGPLDTHQNHLSFTSPDTPVCETETLPMYERRKALVDIQKNWKSNARKISKGPVFFFVTQIEKEVQKIKYIEYLAQHCKIIKHDSNPDDIFNTLVESHQQHDILRKFDKQVIWDCVKARVSVVRAMYKKLKLFEYRNLLELQNITAYSYHSDDLNEVAKLHFSGLNSLERSDELKAYKESLLEDTYLCHTDSKLELKPRKPPVDKVHHTAINPVSKLLLKKFQDGYVLDLNPVVELQKIKASDPISYYSYFIFWQSHKEHSIDRTGLVRIDNVPLDASKETIYQFLKSCGHIYRIELTSGSKFQTAFVTFKYSTDAEKALLLKDNLIDNHVVKITSISVYKPEFARDVDYVDFDYYEDEDDDDDDDEKENEDVDGDRDCDWDWNYDKQHESNFAEAQRIKPAGAPVQEDVCMVLNVLNKYWYYTRSKTMDEIC